MSALEPRRSILVVDDEVFVRLLLVDLFEDAGFVVYEAASASEARSLLVELSDQIELIFTDILMPGDSDGLDLATWAREHCPKAKTIIISGYPGEHGLEGARQHAAFVRKPFDPASLVSLATDLLDDKGLIDT